MTTISASPASSGKTIFTAPQWVKTFYSKFPMVILEQEDEIDWKVRAKEGPDHAVELWVHSSSSTPHHHSKSWASSSPSSLRVQLLFLLRQTSAKVPISFRSWSNESSAPGGTLPTLHVLNQDRLLPTGEIRGWLESTYPLKGKGKEIQGLPSQESYDNALALSHLILGNLYPGYLASLPKQPSNFPLLFPNPPPLASGLSTPLPYSLIGDARDIDTDEVIRKGLTAIEAVEVILDTGDEWLFGAKHPTSIDALVTSHLYVIYSLPTSSILRNKIESLDGLGEYVDRVLDFAQSRLI
ncbi:uncharacterized protein I206_100750 [Kwoniella pini CBS 10737]|uniref:Metaxin glutathione S-transferase domain-containing protein n=1 Tax=Kwoniella pini CBS 10737 TaxID=1296096 RepID=A0A1B9ICM3_9TREE|nr:uncharacterized protein I206_00577 [Kwoniella pini CBS 10737]OCF53276.1 hypothetical protein I206_00577 [Kwoniella pini CBS 10737]